MRLVKKCWQNKKANLKETLLRISVAIQMLEEELAKNNADNGKAERQTDLRSEEIVELEKGDVVN